MGNTSATPVVAAPATFRLTLRQLPIPVKLVLTCFLLAVGLGYVSAMVQIHLKHSARDGDPMPTPDDMIQRFSGLKKEDPNAPPTASKIEDLVGADPKLPLGKVSMAPAFFEKSKGWKEEDRKSLEPEREGERQALLAFVRLKEVSEKERAYSTDKFPLPADLQGKAISSEMVGENGAVKIKTLIESRCQRCHKDQAPDLGSFPALEAHIAPPSTELIDGKYVRSSKQMSVEALTQSTHAHLLSFAVLFTLTGLTFAFTSYPGIVRGVLGPLVLVAQVSDVLCWWLARVPTYGPMFALAIMATGAVVGMGLMLQILLSVFNMYGFKGKAVLLLSFLLTMGAAGLFVGPVVQKALDDEKIAAAKAKDGVKPTVVPPIAPPESVSELERLVMGAREGGAWNGSAKGSMAKAFFEKDKDKTDDTPGYLDVIKVRPKSQVDAEREGERKAFQAWVRLPDSDRKKVYQADIFKFKSNTITPKYQGAQGVKIKSIIKDRCERCHSDNGGQSDFPLDSYENLMKYVTKE